MYNVKRYEEVATGISDFPAELLSFLKVSARYFGLDDVPPETLCRHVAQTDTEAGSGYKNYEKHIDTPRGTA